MMTPEQEAEVQTRHHNCTFGYDTIDNASFVKYVGWLRQELKEQKSLVAGLLDQLTVHPLFQENERLLKVEQAAERQIKNLEEQLKDSEAKFARLLKRWEEANVGDVVTSKEQPR